MLGSLNEIQGYGIDATDGAIGKAKDFYFDDRKWTIRYLVVDTAKWLPGRLVLISPESLGQPGWHAKCFPVNLTQEQIEQSPGIEIDKPVSLQKEEQLVQYYRWPAYWGGIDPLFPAPMGMEPIPATGKTQAALDKWESSAQEQANPHLRSVKEVTGYTIQAKDGAIGHAEDCLADYDTWIIRYFVINTRNWLPGKKVLIAPSWIKDVRWGDQQLEVDLTREQIQHSPEYDPSTPVNRALEVRMFDYYGRPSYWD